MSCKSVMYHYVRPEDCNQPNLFYLHLNDFRKQLDYFEDSYGVVSKAQWYAALNNQEELPDGVILTFDDGLIDHYQYVYPELKSRGHWGIFYISSATLKEKKLLSVHRVHYLLGRFGGNKVLSVLEELLDDNCFIDGFYDHLKAVPYAMQSMDHASLRVKKIVNYALRPEHKDDILSRLFKKLAGDEAGLSKQFYMDTPQIKEMVNDGFTFGAHGHSHNLLTKFSDADLKNEVTGSIESLNQIIGASSDTFSYPYGGPDSWNNQVISELIQQKIRYGFCVDSTDIKLDDLKRSPLVLPRYDCNEFSYGKAYITK